jgi:hypothetical protein
MNRINYLLIIVLINIFLLTGCNGSEEKSENETTLIQNEKQEYSNEENESTEETSIAVVQETTEENTEENDFIQEETSEIETDVNTKAIHEEYPDKNQFVTYTSSEKDFEDENGRVFHYEVHRYFLNDSKYQKVNETLQGFYDKKELDLQEEFESGRLFYYNEREYKEVIWYLDEVTYVGEDYASFLFNEEWTQAATILPYYTTVTIDVQTGEIVDLEDILGCTWSELSQELFGSGELNSDDYAFYLFGEDVHFIYRTNYWVDEIVVRRETEDQEDTYPRRYSIIDKNR